MRWLEMLASGLFAYEVTGSALAVTAVVAARQLPLLLLGAFAGAISEAINRKLILMTALVVAAVTSTLLATLATTGHLELWHVALGNLVSGTMWTTEMSTRRRMVGEAAGPHRIVTAIALDSATNALTRMVGPLLGGLAFEWLAHEGRLHHDGAGAVRRRLCPGRPRPHPGHAPARSSRAFPPRSPTACATPGPSPSSCWCSASPSSPTLFAFSYTGLVAPLGLGEFHVSPALVGVLAAAEPTGALIGGTLIAAGLLRMDRRTAFAGGAALFMAALVIMAVSPSYMAGAAGAVHRRLRHGGLRQHAIDPDADRGAARDALAG